MLSARRKIIEITPIKNILDYVKLTGERSEKYNYINSSLERTERSKDKHRLRKTLEKSDCFRRDIEDKDAIKKTTNERARIPRYLAITSHKFYMKNKGS